LHQKKKANAFTVRCFPVKEGVDPWSPLPVYRNVTVSLNSGAKWEFGASKPDGPWIQDNLGSTAGFVVSNSSLQSCLHETDAWCWSEYDWTHGSGLSKAAICKIQIPDIGLDMFSFVQGVEGLDKPMLGRFFVLDVQHRLYSGILADPLSLPLDDNGLVDLSKPSKKVENDSRSLVKVPNWNEAVGRYRNSETGKNLKKAMINEYNLGSGKKKE